MRVLISGRVTSCQGIDTYIKSLIAGLGGYENINLVTFQSACHNDVLFHEGIINKTKGVLQRIYRDQFDLPRCLKSNNVDMFHCTENYGIPFNLRRKSIVTVHDVISLVHNTMTRFQTYRFKKQVEYAVKHSDGIITGSKNSKKDILKYFDIKENKISVIYYGCDKKIKVYKSEIDTERM